MTSQVRNLWCRSQNKMGPSSKYVSSQHIVDLRQPQVAMKHHLRSAKNTCVAQSLYSEFRPLKWHGIFYMASRIDEAGHTKAFDYPVVEHWGKAEMFSSPDGTRTDNTSVWSRTRYHPVPPKSK